MPSAARRTLDGRLLDALELCNAWSAITGGKVGRPAQRQGQAITRAGIVLLCAALEGYVEELFAECVPLLYKAFTPQQIADVYQRTKERMHNPDRATIDALFTAIGVTNIMAQVRWQKCSNKAVTDWLDKFVKARHTIAHGKHPTLRYSQFKAARGKVALLADRLDAVLAQHVHATTGTKPW